MKFAVSFLADVVVLLHVGFVCFVILGGLLVYKWKWVMWVHVPAAMWGAVMDLSAHTIGELASRGGGSARVPVRIY